MKNEAIIVSISLEGKDIRVGKLWIYERNSKFLYDESWLNYSERFSIQPSVLKLTEGDFATEKDRKIFGVFGDTSPDRWGRNLMLRKRRKSNSQTGTPNLYVSEQDYLLGVSDEARQGALRYSLENNSTEYLSTENISPILKINALLSATQKVIDESENDDELEFLLAPGSSLGGAWPKASVYDSEGNLSIAKFPIDRPDEKTPKTLWEALALKLAKKANIDVPFNKIIKVKEKSVLLVKRFDRIKSDRVPFISAMSMLNSKDNDDEKRSYLEIADSIQQYSWKPKEDLYQLWRRIVFNIMINNVDDHLRNHGFLYSTINKGWHLSPAYDLNPHSKDTYGKNLSLNIDFNSSETILETALNVREDFGISSSEANQIIEEVKHAVSGWKEEAKDLGISNEECKKMKSAFLCS